MRVTSPRWNLAKREQLGGLLLDEVWRPYPRFEDDLLGCCARVVAFSGAAHMVFVGRSPESIFDVITGLLADTSWRDCCTLLNISMSGWAHGDRPRPRARKLALRKLLSAAGLAPEALINGKQPVVLVDLVYRARTFTELHRALEAWTAEAGLDPAGVRAKLRFLGITEARRTSPKTWRWWQHSAWTRCYRSRAIRNVSIPIRLWDYLGNRQFKTLKSNPLQDWSAPRALRPRDTYARKALTMAHQLHEYARRRATRIEFAERLAQEPRMADAAVRSLIVELRRRRRRD